MQKSLFRRGTLINPDGDRICRFKKGDRLQVMTGKHRKSVGSLLKIVTRKGQVVIEGVNKVIRNSKANSQAKEKGGRQEIEAPIAVSNVALVCPKCMKPTRIGHEFVVASDPGAKRSKVRICKRCKARIDD
jgi:large subunit ribosomal protein L24